MTLEDPVEYPVNMMRQTSVAEVNKVDFKIVGYFEAGGSAAESEVWMDIKDLTSARRTQGAISVVNLRATSQSTRDDLMRQ